MALYQEVGERGEILAARYLKRNKYIIIKTNHRLKFGEIDIIARDPIGTLVFIEVKTIFAINSMPVLIPEDNLSRWKLYKVRRASQFFANQNGEMVREQGWRIDLIAIVLGFKKYLKHYKNL